MASDFCKRKHSSLRMQKNWVCEAMSNCCCQRPHFLHTQRGIVTSLSLLTCEFNPSRRLRVPYSRCIIHLPSRLPLHLSAPSTSQCSLCISVLPLHPSAPSASQCSLCISVFPLFWWGCRLVIWMDELRNLTAFTLCARLI